MKNISTNFKKYFKMREMISCSVDVWLQTEAEEKKFMKTKNIASSNLVDVYPEHFSRWEWKDFGITGFWNWRFSYRIFCFADVWGIIQDLYSFF